MRGVAKELLKVLGPAKRESGFWLEWRSAELLKLQRSCLEKGGRWEFMSKINRNVKICLRCSYRLRKSAKSNDLGK